MKHPEPSIYNAPEITLELKPSKLMPGMRIGDLEMTADGVTLLHFGGCGSSLCLGSDTEPKLTTNFPGPFDQWTP